MIDLYETALDDEVLARLVAHINALDERTTDKKRFAKNSSCAQKKASPVFGRCYFGTDMEEDKTWLVSDSF